MVLYHRRWQLKIIIRTDWRRILRWRSQRRWKFSGVGSIKRRRIQRETRGRGLKRGEVSHLYARSSSQSRTAHISPCRQRSSAFLSLLLSPDPVSRASAAAKIRSAYRCNEPRVKIATEKNSENSSPSSVPKINPKLFSPRKFMLNR